MSVWLWVEVVGCERGGRRARLEVDVLCVLRGQQNGLGAALLDRVELPEVGYDEREHVRACLRLLQLLANGALGARRGGGGGEGVDCRLAHVQCEDERLPH